MGRIGRKLRRGVQRAGKLDARRLPSGAGEQKMSELLVDIAEPLLRGLSLPKDEPEYRLALSFAAAIWNATTHPTDVERRRALSQLFVLAGEPLPPSARRMAAEVYKRGRHLYPDDNRVISGVEFIRQKGGRYLLNVASTE
jgi:hypothetical protein